MGSAVPSVKGLCGSARLICRRPPPPIQGLFQSVRSHYRQVDLQTQGWGHDSMKLRHQEDKYGSLIACCAMVLDLEYRAAAEIVPPYNPAFFKRVGPELLAPLRYGLVEILA